MFSKLLTQLLQLFLIVKSDWKGRSRGRNSTRRNPENQLCLMNWICASHLMPSRNSGWKKTPHSHKHCCWQRNGISNVCLCAEGQNLLGNSWTKLKLSSSEGCAFTIPLNRSIATLEMICNSATLVKSWSLNPHQPTVGTQYVSACTAAWLLSKDVFCVILRHANSCS